MLQLETGNILTGARAESKEDAIRQVAGLLVRTGCIEPGYADSMLDRERVANTYLGRGVAIPHGMPKDRELILRTGIAVLQVPDGVAWQGGETARLVVGIAVKSDEHIEVLGNLTRLLDDRALLARLVATSDPEEISEALGAARKTTPARDQPAELGQAVEATVAGSHGLHARPATAFVELAGGSSRTWSCATVSGPRTAGASPRCSSSARRRAPC